jgi:cytochrome b involved in lipid metabolism
MGGLRQERNFRSQSHKLTPLNLNLCGYLQITAEEIKKHTKRDDCWIVIHGKVCTSFYPAAE